MTCCSEFTPRAYSKFEYIFHDPTYYKLYKNTTSVQIQTLFRQLEIEKDKDEREFCEAMTSVTFKLPSPDEPPHTPSQRAKYNQFELGRRMLINMSGSVSPSLSKEKRSKMVRQEQMYYSTTLGENTKAITPSVYSYPGAFALGNGERKCNFCINAGFHDGEYGYHSSYKCPLLLSTRCLKCNGFGHTRRFCPIVQCNDKYCDKLYKFSSKYASEYKKTFTIKRGHVVKGKNNVFSWTPLENITLTNVSEY